MKTSLKDIAETLKLSKTTISWVLSGKGDEKGISLATQEKVFQCAKQLNYQPNLLARSLNTHNRINHTGYYRLFLLQSCPFYRKGSGNTRLFINDL